MVITDIFIYRCGGAAAAMALSSCILLCMLTLPLCHLFAILKSFTIFATSYSFDMEVFASIIGVIASIIGWIGMFILPFVLIYFIYMEAIKPFFDLFKKDNKKSSLNSK